MGKKRTTPLPGREKEEDKPFKCEDGGKTPHYKRRAGKFLKQAECKGDDWHYGELDFNSRIVVWVRAPSSASRLGTWTEALT